MINSHPMLLGCCFPLDFDCVYQLSANKIGETACKFVGKPSVHVQIQKTLQNAVDRAILTDNGKM